MRPGLPATPDQIARARRRVRHLEVAGLSRREIARRAGVTASTVTKLMNELSPHLTRTTATRLAAAR
jgi:transposase